MEQSLIKWSHGKIYNMLWVKYIFSEFLFKPYSCKFRNNAYYMSSDRIIIIFSGFVCDWREWLHCYILIRLVWMLIVCTKLLVCHLTCWINYFCTQNCIAWKRSCWKHMFVCNLGFRAIIFEKFIIYTIPTCWFIVIVIYTSRSHKGNYADDEIFRIYLFFALWLHST